MPFNGLPPSYDTWKTTPPPDPEVVRYCDYCDEEMYEGEEVLSLVTGDVIHEDCFSDYAKDELQPSIIQLDKR